MIAKAGKNLPAAERVGEKNEISAKLCVFIFVLCEAGGGGSEVI